MRKKQLSKWLFPSILAGLSVLVMARCSSNETTVPTYETKIFTSTTVDGHAHTVTLTRTDIQARREEGYTVTTSSTSGHTHTFKMTKAQCESVNNDISVTITTSTDSGHAHDFAIANWWW